MHTKHIICQLDKIKQLSIEIEKSIKSELIATCNQAKEFDYNTSYNDYINNEYKQILCKEFVENIPKLPPYILWSKNPEKYTKLMQERIDYIMYYVGRIIAFNVECEQNKPTK